ncbi:MAG: hypothetical protein K6U74_08405 [Firmicutes bacterium]|nr:hypothetical protein [Bacillota bacterium]
MLRLRFMLALLFSLAILLSGCAGDKKTGAGPNDQPQVSGISQPQVSGTTQPEQPVVKTPVSPDNPASGASRAPSAPAPPEPSSQGLKQPVVESPSPVPQPPAPAPAGNQERTESLDAGGTFPSFTLADLSGKKINSSELFASNKLTVVNLWGTF